MKDLSVRQIIETPITDGSNNAVSSNGVFDALAVKANKTDATFDGTFAVDTTSLVVIGDASESSGANRMEIDDTSGTTIYGALNLQNGDAIFRDGSFFIAGVFDLTKKLKFDASGITTGTTRILAAPNQSGTIALKDNSAQAYLSASVTTTNTTATAITGLSFSIGANEVWSFEVHMKVGTSTNTGTKYAVDVPASATFTADVEGTTSAATAYTEERVSTDAALTATAFNTANLTTAAVDAFVRIRGVVANSSTAGTVQIQHAKVTSGTATVYNGSYLTARRIS